MKKLYRNSTVHPSPPPPPPSSSDPLALLPAAIFTLAAALSPEDKEVLAYLILSYSSSSSSDSTINSTGRKDFKGCAFSDHSVTFNCSCFRCYMSFWIRWDSSPNRQLIHEIIESLENDLLESEISNKIEKGSKKKSRRKKMQKSLTELTRNELTESDSTRNKPDDADDDNVRTVVDLEDGDGGGGGSEFNKGLMRKFVSFIGETIWGVHGGKEHRN